MKYDYSVKVNGKWYQPGEDVPDISETNTADVVTAKAENEPYEPDKKPGRKKN